jgi:hypothetical protein
MDYELSQIQLLAYRPGQKVDSAFISRRCSFLPRCNPSKILEMSLSIHRILEHAMEGRLDSLDEGRIDQDLNTLILHEEPEYHEYYQQYLYTLQSESEEEDEGCLGWWDSNGGYPCGYINPLGYDN